jgi:hypothetical protein
VEMGRAFDAPGDSAWCLADWPASTRSSLSVTVLPYVSCTLRIRSGAGRLLVSPPHRRAAPRSVCPRRRAGWAPDPCA